jgi:hypothetical protein
MRASNGWHREKPHDSDGEAVAIMGTLVVLICQATRGLALGMGEVRDWAASGST